MASEATTFRTLEATQSKAHFKIRTPLLHSSLHSKHHHDPHSALVVATIATQAHAAQFCQCLFQDGSHCCVYSDPEAGNQDCQKVCSGAHRADGATNPDPLEVGTSCNAGGKYSTVSGWNAQFRKACYKQ